MNPLVSIIVPVFNVEQYIRQCVDSILAQSFVDYELLLIDDGSSDASGKICDQYAEADQRIRVFHKKNGGVSSARNLGIDNAKGEWITFVDADDILDVSFLEGLLKPVLKSLDIDFVQAGCTNYQAGHPTTILQQYEDYESDDPVYLFNKFKGLTFSKLFRSDLIKNWKCDNEKKLYFDEKMKIAEDMAFTLDYIVSVKKYAFVSEVGYYYRRDNSNSATKNKRYFYEAELHSYRHRVQSVQRYVELHKLTEDSCRYRYQQLGEALLLVCKILYKENVYKRKERVDALKVDFNFSDFLLLNYLKFSMRKRIFAFLLKHRMFYLFDFLLSAIYSAKRVLS